jgi:hypothetical protein
MFRGRRPWNLSGLVALSPALRSVPAVWSANRTEPRFSSSVRMGGPKAVGGCSYNGLAGNE